MFDFHEKRKIRNLVYSKPVVFLLLFITVLLSFSVYNRYVASREVKMKLDLRRSSLIELEQHAQMLESKVKYLENDRGIEEELRNRFNVVREGEKAVILIDSKRIVSEEEEIINNEVNEKPEPQKRFFDLF